MRKYLLMTFCLLGTLCFADNCEKTVADLAYYALLCQQTKLSTPLCSTNIHLSTRHTDKGIWGGQAGNARIYCDITMPTITSECLVDVGAAMSRMDGVLGMCPRWFTMFNPIACPTDELFGAAKAKTAIMLTMRTYF